VAPVSRTPVALALSVALGLVAPVASASPTYPALIQQQLNLNYVPACTICHRDNNGGIGTVVTPFGRALMGLGLHGGSDPASLQNALNRAKAEGLDSGGDGIPDIQELVAGMDPSAGGGGLPQPMYGCAVARSPAPTNGISTAVAFGALALLMWRRGKPASEPHAALDRPGQRTVST
jgi:hypothetical protein